MTSTMTFNTRRNFNPRLLPRSHKRVTRYVNRFVMDHHWRENLPDHFEPGAGRKYGYARRTSVISLRFLRRTNRGAYDRIRKLKGKDGKPTSRGFYKDVKKALDLNPLEFSGDTRRMVTNVTNRKITSTANRGRLTVRTPNYVASRLKSGKGGRARQMQREALKRAAELEAMTPREIITLRKVFGDEYAEVQRNPSHPQHGLVVYRQRARRRS